MDIAKQLTAKMRERGAIGSADVAEFGSDQTNRADRGKALSASTQASVPEQANNDPIVNMSESAAPELLEQRQQQAELAASPEQLASELYDGAPQEAEETIELTPEDKAAFIEAMVKGSRFERPFSLFGGRLTGVLRSRTSMESVAILKELGRQLTSIAYMTEQEYSTLLRLAMIKAQLKELNGVIYSEMTEPLMAQSIVTRPLDGIGKEEVKAPAWFDEMQVQFGKKDEGRYAAVYREIRLFEKKYWVLVEHAKDQNFWSPSQSTSA